MCVCACVRACVCVCVQYWYVLYLRDECKHHWQVVLHESDIHHLLILGEEVAGGGVWIKDRNQQFSYQGTVNEDLQDLKRLVRNLRKELLPKDCEGRGEELTSRRVLPGIHGNKLKDAVKQSDCRVQCLLLVLYSG